MKPSFRFLLDTNIVSQLIREPQGLVAAQIERVGEEKVCINVVIAAELRFGAKKKRSPRLTRQVNKILSAIEILPLEAPVDEHYAEIRDFLEKKGKLIGANDLFIAAHARALGLTLVTANLREFSRVPRLKVKESILPM